MTDIDELLKRRDLLTITLDEIGWLQHEVIRLRAINLQFAEQAICEREHLRMARIARNEAEACCVVNPREISTTAYLRLHDAYRAAKSNDECAEILRVYCTDGDAFWKKFGGGYPKARADQAKETRDARP